MSDKWTGFESFILGGGFADVPNPPIARPDGLPITVLVRGDGIHANAPALADDIRHLVEGFVRQLSSSEHTTTHAPHRATEQTDEFQIAVHLGLNDDAQQELLQKIKELLQEGLLKKDSQP
ncbi:hypothetical protein AYJ54_22010 [Bradyrhizobium centrolobii]|uniref:Uncharacterized protein n=1 Tax=Bradyrhizobium centrolobii TaxID=1505087 RepID=A0A176YEV7_9BRAD|nr:hypothetical protein [Bradyrhizobium centrolobii]OAF05130.1 hypothetical protein AYJ54_22010 [Bradyrhizobium centrolobii]